MAKNKINASNALKFLTDEINYSDGSFRIIEISELVPFRNHPFTLYSGERMDDMTESVKKNGVLVPIIVRPSDEGKFEVLSGHNRTKAAENAGLSQIPAIVKDNLTEEEAMLYVIETNLIQRGFSEMRLSEKAAVVAIEGMSSFSQGKRNDIRNELTALENGAEKQKSDTYLSLAQEYSLSRRSVARLIRISKLSDELKIFADNGRIGIYPAVEISYTDLETQKNIADILSEASSLKININSAKEIRRCCKDAPMSKETLEKILGAKTENKVEKKCRNIKISFDIYKKYFSDNVSADEIEETVSKALEFYFSKHS